MEALLKFQATPVRSVFSSFSFLFAVFFHVVADQRVNDVTFGAERGKDRERERERGERERALFPLLVGDRTDCRKGISLHTIHIFFIFFTVCVAATATASHVTNQSINGRWQKDITSSDQLGAHRK